MQKTIRLLEIEKLISEADITTQEELLRKLSGKGIPCTQATLSRNLRQLGISRIPNGAGGYKYSLPEIGKRNESVQFRLNLVPVIREIIEARGMIVIKTFPGNASSTAFYIDGAARYEIAGTIAGDDTILLIPRDGITSAQVHSCLEALLPGVHEQVRKK
jgi:transcriptional regulator of arginine metabolism